MKTIIALLLGLTLLTTCTGSAYAQAPVPRSCLVNEAAAAANLFEHHGEVLTHAALASIKGQHKGVHVMQIYVNPETRSWTGVVIHPASEGGFACVAGSGEAWLDIPAAIQGDDA